MYIDICLFATFRTALKFLNNYFEISKYILSVYDACWFVSHVEFLDAISMFTWS